MNEKNTQPQGEGAEAEGAETDDFFFTRSLESQTEALDLIAEALRAADPGAVFGEPQAHGKVTVITASELTAGLGVGFGSGGSKGEGSGAGGGGGGFSGGRPVAVISITEEGVKVEPVVDVTKLGIALFTTLGAMLLSWRALGRAGR